MQVVNVSQITFILTEADDDTKHITWIKQLCMSIKSGIKQLSLSITSWIKQLCMSKSWIKQLYV